MKKIAATAALALVFYLVFIATTGSAGLLSEPAVAKAREFAQMIDSRKAEAAYAQASTLLRVSRDQQEWSQTINRSYALLGPVQERTLVAVRSVQTFPKLPDGEYLIVQFNAQTAHKSKAAEVILLHQQGSDWLVADYSIR